MRHFWGALCGAAYATVVAFSSVLFLGGGGHGLLFLPGSLLASPLVFLGPIGYGVAPILWSTVGALAASRNPTNRRRSRDLVLIHYLGIPCGILMARALGSEDLERIRQHTDLFVETFVPVLALYLFGQVGLWT